MIGTEEVKDIMNTDSENSNLRNEASSGKSARNYCDVRRPTASEISFNTTTSHGDNSVMSAPPYTSHVKGILLELVAI